MTIRAHDDPFKRTSFTTLAEWHPTFPPSRPKLATLLQLDADWMSPLTKTLLERIDGEHSTETELDLLKGVRAYYEFQDMLSAPLGPFIEVNGQRRPRFENSNYCYYESIVYLRESLTAWIQGNDLAAVTLLRPFMELSLFHLYWFLRCEHDSYGPYYEWLDGDAGKPSFTDVRKYVMENVPTVEKLKPGRLDLMSQFLKNVYDSTSSYNHTPTIDQSVFAMGGGMGESTVATFAYYTSLVEMLIRQLVHLYLYAYPMTLFPVDRFRKFGYGGGPVGLLADQSTGNIVHDFIGDNFSKLQSSFKDVQVVQDVRAWFDCQADLTDSVIEAEWQSSEYIDERIKGVAIPDERLAVMKAHGRSIAWSLSYSNVKAKTDDVPDDFVERAQALLRNL